MGRSRSVLRPAASGDGRGSRPPRGRSPVWLAGLTAAGHSRRPPGGRPVECRGGRRERGPGGRAVPVPQHRPAAAWPLEHPAQRRPLRHRLPVADRDGQGQYLRQHPGGNQLLLPGPRRARRTAGWLAFLCGDVPAAPLPPRHPATTTCGPTGCPPQPGRSPCTCAPTGPSSRSSTAPGHHHMSSGSAKT